MREQTPHAWPEKRGRARLLLSTLLLLIAALLAACGGSQAPTTPASGDATSPAAPAGSGEATPGGDQAASGEPTTIRWMIWSDDVANDKNLQEEIALYNGSQSEVRVELIGASWAEYTAKLQAMIAANTPPDVVSIQSEADFVSKGFVRPIDDLIASEQIDIDQFVPGAIEPAYDGKIYGFRHDTAYWLLYYNKDMFDAAGLEYPPASGWTLDAFMEAACKLARPDEGVWGMHNIHWLTGILAQQQGLPYLEMVDGVPQYRLDDPQTMAFYQRLGDFINQQNCQPTADQNTSLGGADPFVGGKAAMKFDGNWAFGNIQQNASFNYGVAPLPGLKQPNVGMKIGIVPSSPNQEAAWKFLRWLTYEPEATRYRTERGMGQPAVNDAQAIESFLSGPTAPDGLADVFEVLNDPGNSFRVLDVPGASEANNIITPASDEVMNGLSQATDVLPAAVEQANQVLAEEWQEATGGQ